MSVKKNEYGINK